MPKTLNFNAEQNSASLGITPPIYFRILKKAVEQTADDIKKIEAALPINDFNVIKAVTHKFKGDYDNLRITDLSDIARQMEELVKKEQASDVDALLDLVNEFSAYFEQLKKIVTEKAGT